MSDTKNLKEAMDHLKTYRNAASEMGSEQIAFITKLVKSATQAFEKPEDERSVIDKSLIETFKFMADDIVVSLKAIEKFNKASEDYLKGYKLLAKISGSEQNDI